MGREIRTVIPGWEHPQREYCPHAGFGGQPAHSSGFTSYDRGKCFIPMHEGYKSKIAEFEKLQAEHGTRYAIDYFGSLCSDDYIDADWNEEDRTCVQLYETVSEGCPVSPVFSTREALADWLVGEGYSRGQADAFVKSGWAPSLVVQDGKVYDSIESAVLA